MESRVRCHNVPPLRSRSFTFAPGPNRSWNRINSSMSSSIIFIVESSPPPATSTARRGAELGVDNPVSRGAAAPSAVLASMSMRAPSPAATALLCACSAFPSASFLRVRSIAAACSRPTHSTSDRTRLFISPTLMRLLGHLTFTPRSVVRSCDSRLLPSRTEPRTSSGRGTSVGRMASRWAR
ncbi:hypothetical protein GSI_01637 [Ganoderma sinense ZZ0214-1]|uniref:Uncharacterized protein n=1 Tax=Ganoderma sinense ZZ0214-1 TaxID=1077348 RepID=A0A2G8SQD2_9APHY|nr:hypothetical protein GSI_01637 [Ganoderma sinense ZZ0214-1]